MMKKLFVIFSFLTFSACQSSTHRLDLGNFTISVPKNWKYEQEEGIDSFVGGIKADGVSLSFDCSGMGYANHLVEAEAEYLKSKRWYNGEYGYPENRDNISARKVTATENKQYHHADYVGEVKSDTGKLKVLPITIPAEIKSQNFQVDSDAHYVYKTIWPKIPGKGMTGIYIHSRKSSFNFQMNGKNLSAQNQELALRAFKSIKFKQ